jgi:hypothetical protein
MTPHDDLKATMLEALEDDALIEALLTGQLSAATAPPALAPLVRTIEQARATVVPATGSEGTIAAIAAAVRTGAAASAEPSKRRGTIVRIATMKTVVVGAVLFGATAAAAATGQLPGPVQRAVADAAAHVGISIPGSHPSSGLATLGGSTGTTAATSPCAGSGTSTFLSGMTTPDDSASAGCNQSGASRNHDEGRGAHPSKEPSGHRRPTRGHGSKAPSGTQVPTGSTPSTSSQPPGKGAGHRKSGNKGKSGVRSKSNKGKSTGKGKSNKGKSNKGKSNKGKSSAEGHREQKKRVRSVAEGPR